MSIGEVFMMTFLEKVQLGVVFFGWVALDNLIGTNKSRKVQVLHNPGVFDFLFSTCAVAKSNCKSIRTQLNIVPSPSSVDIR